MGDADAKASHYEDYDYDELPEEVKQAVSDLSSGGHRNDFLLTPITSIIVLPFFVSFH